MVDIKVGVKFTYSLGGLVILQAIKTVSRMMDKDLTITSGSDDGGTEHELGNAYDVRSHDLNNVEKQQFLANLNNILPRDKFYYFLESPDTLVEHFHIQVRQNTKYEIQDFLGA